MAHNYIIQWNCRGLRSNREDIELLISKYSPAAICLQETMLKRDQIQTFKHYSAYYKNSINGHGGVCILVKNNFIHSQVQFQADLQAVAVCITIGDGGGRPSSVMSLGVTSVGGHSHGHPASPIGVGSSWEDIDPRSPEPLVVRGGWLWLIWVGRWTT